MNLLDAKRKLLPMGQYRSMGGGGGSSGPTQTTVQNTNVPEYARPYVETMLGAGQQQIFNYDKDAEGNMVPTTIKPYQPFSSNPNDYFAGFSPMQQQSFQGAANLTTSPQLGQASALAGASGIGSLNTGQFGQNEAQQYMNPYLQSSLAPQLQMMQQQQGQQATQRSGQATQAGAFGGSRFGIQNAQAGLNDQLAQQNMIGQGYNQAFNQAQNQFNTDQARRLQGLGQGIQAAGALGQLGQTQYGQQVGNIQLQNQMGAQQQGAEQQKINQQVQDYATAQQYPMMQLANMNGLLRGLPLQQSTTQMYQAAPSTLSQVAGLGTTGIAGLGLYNAMNKP
jgi:hypothetical protein